MNLAHLKARPGWVGLGLLLVLVLNATIRWHTLGMPLERDEGEYAYAGQLIREGVPPYQLACNMKFPGVYYAYAGIEAALGESPRDIRSGLLIVTSATTVLVFLIGVETLGSVAGLMAAAIFACLSAVPLTYGLAGHATHFVVLFACVGTYALLRAEKNPSIAWSGMAGLAFGLAILMKQHGVFFPVVLAGWLGWGIYKQPVTGRKTKWAVGVGCLIGCAIVLLAAGIGLAVAGVWSQFYFWTIQYAREYVTISPWGVAGDQFAKGFLPIFDSGIGVWLVGLAGLVWTLLRGRLGNRNEMGAALFLAGLVAASPGFYFRGHYFLLMMPGLALLSAGAITTLATELKKVWCNEPGVKAISTIVFCLLIAELGAHNFDAWFRMDSRGLSQLLYGTSPFAETAEIATYLKQHTAPDDTIAVLGSEPQIFYLSHRRSATTYLYTYPFNEPQPLAPRMEEEFIHQIEAARPKYVVFVNLVTSWLSVIGPSRPPDDAVPRWWDSYSANYEPVGLVNLHDDRPSESFWTKPAMESAGEASGRVFIFQRRAAPRAPSSP